MSRSLKVERVESYMPQRQAIWIPNVPNGHKISFLEESKCFTLLIRKIKTSSIWEYACSDVWLNPSSTQQHTGTRMLHQGAADTSAQHRAMQAAGEAKAGQCWAVPGQPWTSCLLSCTKAHLLNSARWEETAEVWPLAPSIRLLLQLCYCVLDCCAPEDGSGQPTPPSSTGFCLGGCWPTGEWFQGSYSWKHTKPELRKKSKMVTMGTWDLWGKPECCACDCRSICWFSSFYCV